MGAICEFCSIWLLLSYSWLFRSYFYPTFLILLLICQLTTNVSHSSASRTGLDVLYEYELFTVINHEGQIDNGHYTNYARFKDEWFKFDDDKYVYFFCNVVSQDWVMLTMFLFSPPEWRIRAYRHVYNPRHTCSSTWSATWITNPTWCLLTSECEKLKLYVRRKGSSRKNKKRKGRKSARERERKNERRKSEKEKGRGKRSLKMHCWPRYDTP